MANKLTLTFVSMLLNSLVFSQDLNSNVQIIDKEVVRIDSIENGKLHIGHFIVPKYSDNDTTRLYNRYIFDTVSRDFFKCIYDCTFRGKEEITFYLKQNQLIKAIVKVHEYNEKPFNALYYFDNGVVVYKKEDNVPTGSHLWDISRIIATSKQYLEDISGILKYLDSR